jgi:HPt (histidine-containing phosphotransfer) domain-containing protein
MASTLSQSVFDLDPFDTTPVFDPTEALDRVCGDLELLAELVAMLRDSQAELLQQLTEAIARNDAVDIGHAAHAIKGALSSITTGRAYRLAAWLEHTADAGHIEHADAALHQLQASIANLDAAVDRFLANPEQFVPT